jgi:hypothetical protein
MEKLLELPEDDETDSGCLFAYSPKFQAMLEQGRAQAKAGKTVPFDAFWQEAEHRQAKKLSS